MGTGRSNAHAMNTIDTPISTRPTHQLASVPTYRSTGLSLAPLSMVAEQSGGEAGNGQHDTVDAEQRADDVANVE